MRSVTMQLPVCLLCLLTLCDAANILGLFPTTAKSQFLVSEALMKGLAARGHNVTVFSCFPQKELVINYSDVSVKSYRTIYNSSTDMKTWTDLPLKIWQLVPKFLAGIESSAIVLKSPEVLDILTRVNFDVVFHEIFVEDVFLEFAQKFNSPVISVNSQCVSPWIADRYRIPQGPSYIPAYTTGYSSWMDFQQRLSNMVTVILWNLIYQFSFKPKSEEIIPKYFNRNSLDLKNSIPLMFINTHFTLFGSRPFTPQVVEIGGIHVLPSKSLTQELDKWINESTEGVIYFSFGSMLRGATLPTDKVKAFLEVFGSLPQRVLWKWEDDNIEDLPKNIKIMKWLPQRDILAHPNVKVFISHGGLLGTTEAVVSAVPILGIPMYGDQPNNVAALVENQVAIHVDYNNISVASLSYALNTLINDKSYSENAKELSRRFLDRPQSPLDTAVYWTEYVIRHKGAPHLQSAAVHLPWYQYYLLDVIAVLTAALLVLLAFVYYTIKSCLRLVLPKRTTKLKRN